MKNSAILAAATNAGVRHEAGATVVGAEKLEERFQLILHHARSNAFHDLYVRIRTHFAHIAQHLQLMVRFEDTQFADFVVKNVPIHHKLVDTVKGGLF